MNYYIANKIRIPILSSVETICWMLFVTFPFTIIIRIVETIISKKISKRFRKNSVVTLDENCVQICYKKKINILYSDIRDVSYNAAAISVFDLSSIFEMETITETYGKLTIKTNNKKYVIKYLEFGENAKNIILNKIAILN